MAHNRHKAIKENYSSKRKDPEQDTTLETHMSFPPLPKEPSEDPFVIRVKIFNTKVYRVYVDGGSECDVIYEHCFLQFPQKIRARITPSRTPLIGFAGERVSPLGEIDLDVTIGDYPHERTETLDFLIVRSPSPYNMLLGRPGMRRMEMIVSTIHSLAKYKSPGGVGTLSSEYKMSRQVLGIKKSQEVGCTPAKPAEPSRGEEKVIINPGYDEQPITIGKQLSEGIKSKLRRLLRKNTDVFAWEYSDMVGVPRVISVNGEDFVTEHRLNEYKHISPLHQKRRSLSAERDEAACKEVDELVKAGIIRRSTYPLWVANPVMVRKSDGGWRMCVDFTNINKACPKDCYPLPEIDWKVESLTSYRFKCFLDAYKGYHQIQMAEEDEDKTAFYTSKGTFCYRKMPFGLKNAGAIYQRLIDKAFQHQIGRNLEAYVDDMVIKSRTEEVLLKDIQETFDTLRSIGMKLNPKKCSFGVEEGKFLGYYITDKGIKANPSKVDKLSQSSERISNCRFSKY